MKNGKHKSRCAHQRMTKTTTLNAVMMTNQSSCDDNNSSWWKGHGKRGKGEATKQSQTILESELSFRVTKLLRQIINVLQIFIRTSMMKLVSLSKMMCYKSSRHHAIKRINEIQCWLGGNELRGGISTDRPATQHWKTNVSETNWVTFNSTIWIK